MGYAAYRIWTADAPQADKRRALVFYGVQLALNFLWSPIFFGLNAYLAAFFILLALWILIYITVRLFSNINERAGDLLIPYLLWVTFALSRRLVQVQVSISTTSVQATATAYSMLSRHSKRQAV